MKKHLILVCASVSFVALGAHLAHAGQQVNVGSKTTSELRDSGAGTIGTNTPTALQVLQMPPIALQTIITNAANSNDICSALMSASKQKDAIMQAFLAKMENDITFRDAVLIKILSDMEFVNIVLQKYSKDYPKVASTLAATVQQGA